METQCWLVTVLLLSALQVALMLLFFSVLLGLYVAPLYITSPCITDPESLGPRPDVIGRRGAPMVSQRAAMFCASRTRTRQAAESSDVGEVHCRGTSEAALSLQHDWRSVLLLLCFSLVKPVFFFIQSESQSDTRPRPLCSDALLEPVGSECIPRPRGHLIHALFFFFFFIST